MLKRSLAAMGGAASAIAIAGSAYAAEPLPPPPPPPVPIFTWTGVYIGIQIGGVWARDSASLVNPGSGPNVQNVNGVLIPFAIPAVNFPFTANASGVIGGGHIGYDLQINQWVLGVEGSVDGTSMSTAQHVNAIPRLFEADLRTRSDVQGSIRGRLGIAFDRLLLYGTGGVAFAGITDFYDTTRFGRGTANFSRTRTGWTAGGGIAYAITNNWSIGAEYRYSDFGHYSDVSNIAFFSLSNVNRHFTENQVEGRLSYKFDTYAPVPVVSKY